MSGNILIKRNYTYVTRSLIRLFNEGRLSNIENIVVEDRYGYLTRIVYKNGYNRITYGNDLGINSGASCDLAKDKGYTKFMLRDMGVNCPKGEEFLLPWWADTIRNTQEKHGNFNIKTIDESYSYISEELAYPIYIKPVNGSKGLDIYKVEAKRELDEIFDIYNSKRIKVAVIEETIQMPDYRIIVLDGSLISAYRRVPLNVIGDGVSNIKDLILSLQEKFISSGRDTLINPNDPRIIKHLENTGYNLDYIPLKNENITLLSISNLSAGGSSVDITDTINNRWVDIAVDIAKNFNLRLSGIDLACSNIDSEDSEYSVLEVNGAPGLDNYASSGEKQKEIVDQLYVKVFHTF